MFTPTTLDDINKAMDAIMLDPETTVEMEDLKEGYIRAVVVGDFGMEVLKLSRRGIAPAQAYGIARNRFYDATPDHKRVIDLMEAAAA